MNYDADTSHNRFYRASRCYAACFNRDAYTERTARNHYWIGGSRGQEAIRGLALGVAGLGGMGSNIAQHLVRLGVGNLRIADPDRIEATNLNRQVIANQKSLGKTKVEAAIEDLRNIAEDYELVAYGQGVDEHMVEEFVSGCDAIVDEIDVYQLTTHVLLHRAARACRIPLYSAFAVGFGIHFYKFEGDDYTFEDLLGNRPEQWNKPTAEFILERFARPYPSYLTARRVAEVAGEISRGTTPIFGPTTLMGHSIVTIRMILDLLTTAGAVTPEGVQGQPRTPVMPEFLVLDLGDLSCKISCAPR
jgi:molybdopterin/thiamine biosynthesis adenylyltransferase